MRQITHYPPSQGERINNGVNGGDNNSSNNNGINNPNCLTNNDLGNDVDNNGGYSNYKSNPTVTKHAHNSSSGENANNTAVAPNVTAATASNIVNTHLQQYPYSAAIAAANNNSGYAPQPSINNGQTLVTTAAGSSAPNASYDIFDDLDLHPPAASNTGRSNAPTLISPAPLTGSKTSRVLPSANSNMHANVNNANANNVPNASNSSNVSNPSNSSKH